MRALPRLAIAATLALASGLAARPALADAIDGDWCLGTEKLTIHGSDIVTPAGTAMQGNYDRHAFAYVVPDNEPDAGAEIYMRQINEETMRLMVGSWTADGVIWRRCEFVS